MTIVYSNRKCFVGECSRDWKAQRLCRMHYKLYVRRGWDFPPPLHVDCLLDGCTVNATSNGLCLQHKEKFRSYFRCIRHLVSDAAEQERVYRVVQRIQQFWSTVDQTPGFGRDGDCWEWRGYLNNKGYGQFGMWSKRWFCHRLSFKLHYGRIYRSLLVLHSCDNPLCVNPAHLRQGTFQDNTNDAKARNRTARGTRVGGVVLNEEKVRYIRDELAKGRTAQSIGKDLSVSGLLVGSVKRGNAWGWVSNDGDKWQISRSNS